MRVTASSNSRIVTEALDDRSHETGWGQPRVEGWRLIPDHIPPRFRHRGMLPQGRVGEIARVGRHDECATNADCLQKSFDNGLGAAGIIFSLFYEFNLSAFAIESFWLAISLFGVFCALRIRISLSDDDVKSKDN